MTHRSNELAAHSASPTAEYDLLVIGSGGAGVAAAIQGAELGARVVIVERGTLGGTCVNVGCIPSKNLIEAAVHYHAARTGFPGIAPCTPALDWNAVVAQKDALVAELRATKYADVLASYPEIDVLSGHARLLAGDRVRVGDAEYRARKVIVATGSSPAMPPIPGLDAVGALDSTTAMALDELPKSLIVLGGSAVGLELGQTFSRFGTKVIVLELTPRLLPNEDQAIAETLRAHLAAEGIEIHTGVATTRVERDGREIVARVRQGSGEGRFRAEHILVATGRRANTWDLGLAEAGVELSERGFIRVDATLQTTNPDVYAAGDVTGGPGYVYVAAAGGRVAAENALSGERRELDLSAVPNVTFTSPQVASIGLTEAAARAAGHHIEVSTLAMEHVPRALVSHDRRGLVKVVAEVGTGRFLGVHAVAPNAGEFMGQATLAIRLGLTARELTGVLHAYLTWGESVKLAAQGFARDVSKLSCCA
ncbi:MAG: mercury(II) reductase [Gemmatimonadaceae bacterium]